MEWNIKHRNQHKNQELSTSFVDLTTNLRDAELSDATIPTMTEKLEYLAVYGRTSMGVPVGELQKGR